MISCNEAVRQLWEYLDGAVDESQRASVEEHLRFCRRCCGEVEFAGELRKLLVANAAEDVPVDVRTRLLATLSELEVT